MTNNDLLDEPTPYKEPGDINQVTVIVPLLAVAFVGAIFKLMHWPGYSLLVLAPMGAIAAYVVIQALFGKKSRFNWALLLLNLLLLGYFLWGALFNGGYPFNEIGLLVYGGVFVLVFFPILLIRRAKGSKQESKNRLHAE